MRLLVGFDDTDSSRGYCTTYLAYRIAADLGPAVRVLPRPRLVRLNPNIPFKTRGNAAVCLEVEAGDVGAAAESLVSKLEELSDVEGGANSGMVVLQDMALLPLFRGLYAQALTGVVSPDRVRRFLKEHRVLSFELGNGMGVVGAASSLGFGPDLDHTFELIAYRKREYWGTRRLLDASSVRAMDKETFPATFNNYDYQKRKVLIAPHGPDPVFFGVRGASPSFLAEALRRLKFDEAPDGYMVYLTNQHTDAHLSGPLAWKTYSSGFLEGKAGEVTVGPGGHVYFPIETGSGTYQCAAYEPTGDLRRVAKLLRPGDTLRVSGGVRRATARHSMVLNVEKLEVLGLATRRGRTLVPGTYIASPRANRHLTRPYSRYPTAQPAADPDVPWFRQFKESPALAQSP